MCQDCQPELQLYQCIDGENAFTITTAAFTMPAESGGVTIQVSDVGQFTGKWASPGQIIYISSGLLTNGYFAVVSSNSTSISVINIENTSSGNYTQNAPPGTIFPIGSKVSPAGIQGPDGKQGPTGSQGSTGPAGANGMDGIAIIDTLTYNNGVQNNNTGGIQAMFSGFALDSNIQITTGIADKWMTANKDGLFFQMIVGSYTTNKKVGCELGVKINNVINLGGSTDICKFMFSIPDGEEVAIPFYHIQGQISRVSSTSFRAHSTMVASNVTIGGQFLANYFMSSGVGLDPTSSAICETYQDISCPSFSSSTYLIPYAKSPNPGELSLIFFSVWGLKKV